MTVEIITANVNDIKQASDIVELLDSYATDPMGGGQALSVSTRQRLVEQMAKRDFVFSLLAYWDGEPVGLANCIESFSTFAASGVINIHDLFVKRDFRGKGICRKMIERIEQIAKQRDCCKLTLEVLEGNTRAQHVYRRCGFDDYALSSETGRALFWQKKL